jgi:hypothetical protein
MLSEPWCIIQQTETLHYFLRYTSAIKGGEDVGVILRLAEEIDLSPALLARMILEKFYEKHLEEGAEPGE